MHAVLGMVARARRYLPNGGSTRCSIAVAIHFWLATVGIGFGAPDQATAAPKATTSELPNGMQIVVIPDHRVPVVAHMVWYRAGAADDPPGTSGIAHFLEHLMFKSTKKMKSGEFSRILNGLGARGNAQTTHDATSYFQRVPKEHLRAVMELEADRMVNLRLDEEEVRTERNVILEERRSTVDTNPVRVLGEQMVAALYVNHPYGRPPLGWENEMEKLTRRDAAAFYKRFYAPSNAVLIVAGDITAEEVRALAQSTYGRNQAVGIVPRSRPSEPAPVAARHVHLEVAGTPTLLRYYLTPSYPSARPAEAESLDLLAQILGGDDTSRLYRALVAQKLASTASSDYIGITLDSGRMIILILPSIDVGLEKIESVLDGVIADIRDNGIAEEELKRAKATLEARDVFEGDDLLTLARRYGENVALGRSIADIEDLPRRLQAVTLDEIKRSAGEFLNARRSVTGWVLQPPKKAD